MARQPICPSDAEIKVSLKANEDNALRIWFTPLGAGPGLQNFLVLRVANFTPKNGFRIRVPGVLTISKAKQLKDNRVDITFRPSLGRSSGFQAFIFRELTKEARKWHFFRDAVDWVANVKAWKKTVIEAWQTSRIPRKTFLFVPMPCKRSRSPNVVASIPVNFFYHQSSITVRLDFGTTLRLRVPKKIMDADSQTKSYVQVTWPDKMPGEMPKFANFVADYIRTAVLNWTTLDNARCWAKKLRSFIELVNQIWLQSYTDLFWQIRPSIATVDKQFASLPRGSGLFCTKKGKHRIFFGEGRLSHWIKTKLVDGSVEERYAIGGKQINGYTYFLPTEQSFITGVIHPGFKVCHSETPTHTLRFNTLGNFYYLEPKEGKYTCPGDEFTFNYNLTDVFANDH